jgi:hypothetical protein
MKKIALILALVLMLAACGAQTPETTAPVETTEPIEMTLPIETEPAVETEPEFEFVLTETEELLNKIYENVTVELPLMTMPIDLADEFALATYTGAASAEGMIEGAFNESMIGAQAYSLSLVKCESAEKAAELAQTMFDNIDTRKWICVEATEKQAVVAGDLAFFVMLNPEYGVTSDAIVEAFTTVVGTDVTVIK